MLKNVVKTALYSVHRPNLRAFRLSLGYVFHTEQVFDSAIYENLMQFCRDYRSLTGARAICTMMSGANARVRAGMQEAKVEDGALADRMRRLAEIATLGYHGHFWLSPAEFRRPENEIRNNETVIAPIREQMDADLNWFEVQGIKLAPVYAAGWWFMNSFVLSNLATKGFQYDFSFSYSPWFRNPFSYRHLVESRIAPGQSFVVHTDAGDITCVQNLIGCHHTPFSDDFRRNLRKILDDRSRSIVGVVNAHDYDLHAPYTLRCLESLLKRDSAEFWDFPELPGVLASQHCGSIEVTAPVLQ